MGERRSGIAEGGQGVTGEYSGPDVIGPAFEVLGDLRSRVVGKPDPQVFQVAMDRLGPGRTLVIGDHLISDLGCAHAAGLDAALVLTGTTSRDAAEAASDPTPVAIGENLATLVLSN